MATAAERTVDAGTRSQRRDEIVVVASALLRDKGIGISLQDIADELGVTYNALYHHFKSRDDLIYHCLVRAVGLMHDCLEGIAAQPASGLDKVLGFLDAFWALSVKERTPPGLLFSTLSFEAQAELANASQADHDLLQAMIEEGIADGTIAKCDPLVATAMVLHTIYWWPHELDHAPGRTADKVARSVLEMMRRALASS